MNIRLPKHLGMCFGVRDAIDLTHRIVADAPLTVLGELVHNPVVVSRLQELGVRRADLDSPGPVPTRRVLITAHGASNSQKRRWQEMGHQVIDTTCPLVRKAHDSLAALVTDGYFPVVVGTPGHPEVQGLTGDFPDAQVVSAEIDVERLPFHPRIGVIAQTTQPSRFVQGIVARIQNQHQTADVRFIDTVCQPTKNRQAALEHLCRENDSIVVIGGRNSNNTRHLLFQARSLGCRACQVETAADLQFEWFAGALNVGVTAGTSTLPETIDGVVARLKEIAECQEGVTAHST